MKMIDSITDYPFINSCCDYVFESDEHIATAAKEKVYSELKEVLAMRDIDLDNSAIGDAISALNCEYEDIGFINGFIFATKLMKGEFVQEV